LKHKIYILKFLSLKYISKRYFSKRKFMFGEIFFKKVSEVNKEGTLEILMC